MNWSEIDKVYRELFMHGTDLSERGRVAIMSLARRVGELDREIERLHRRTLKQRYLRTEAAEDWQDPIEWSRLWEMPTPRNIMGTLLSTVYVKDSHAAVMRHLRERPRLP